MKKSIHRTNIPTPVGQELDAWNASSLPGHSHASGTVYSGEKHSPFQFPSLSRSFIYTKPQLDRVV